MNIGNIDMNGGYLGSEEVIKCYQGNTVVWEQSSGSPIDYSTMPLTFEILSDGIFRWQTLQVTGTFPKTIKYSLNGGEWTSITSAVGDSAPSLSLTTGDVIQFKGNNNQYAFSNANVLKYDGSFNVCGNIMSLIYEDDFVGKTAFRNTIGNSYTYVFAKLFINNTTLLNTENLILPATTLVARCYNEMFEGCTSLLTAPTLPAMSLNVGGEGRSYQAMFSGCTSLTTAPALPATTLGTGCYRMMFEGCTSLTSAPELPATTLVNTCYEKMFRGCTNLNYIKCLATSNSATSCLSNWVNGVAATGTFVTPSTTNWPTGASGIPNGWTRVNSDMPQYTQLEYIQTNFEYFNTQIVPDSDIKVVLDFELTSFDGGYGNNGIFGSWTNGYDGSDTLAFFANSDRSQFSYYCGGGYEDFAGAYTLGNRYTVELDGNECVITEDGGIPQQYVIGLTVSQGTTPILLGCVYPNPNDNPEPTNIKIYEGWIYNGNTLIAHYLPYYDNYNNCNVLKDAVSNTYLSPWTYTPTV